MVEIHNDQRAHTHTHSISNTTHSERQKCVLFRILFAEFMIVSIETVRMPLLFMFDGG